MTTRIAVLDDYIGCAEEFGDWGSLGADAEVTFYREAIPARAVGRGVESTTRSSSSPSNGLG